MLGWEWIYEILSNYDLYLIDRGFLFVDEVGVEVLKLNLFEVVGVVFVVVVDVIDDGKFRVDVEVEEDVVEVLVGSEKEGVEGVDILNKEEDVDGVEEDEVVDLNVELLKREEEEVWGWFGVVVDVLKVELVVGVVEVVDVVVFELNENLVKGVEVVVEDIVGVVVGVDWVLNLKEGVGFVIFLNENLGGEVEGVVVGVDWDKENVDEEVLKFGVVEVFEEVLNWGVIVLNVGVVGLLFENREFVLKFDDVFVMLFLELWIRLLILWSILERKNLLVNYLMWVLIL